MLSGADDYISLLVIFCIIMYVMNKNLEKFCWKELTAQ